MKGYPYVKMLLLALFFILSFPREVYGSEEGEASYEEALDDYDFSGLEELLQSNETESPFSFRDLVKEGIRGNIGDLGKILWEELTSGLGKALREKKNLMREIILWALASGFFALLSGLWKDTGAARLGSLLLYLGFAALLWTAFGQVLTQTGNILGTMIRFGQLFFPLFFLTVALEGQLTATAMYSGVMVFLQGLIWLYGHWLRECIRVWILGGLLEGILPKEGMDKLTEWMGKGIKGIWKISFGFAMGLQLVQSFLNPCLDQVKNGAIVRLANALPVVGNAIGSGVRWILGTGAVIRNGMGIGGLVLLLILTIGPLCQLMGMYLLFRFLAVLVRPLADPRMGSALDRVGDGCGFLLKILGSCILYFSLVIGLAGFCLRGV